MKLKSTLLAIVCAVASPLVFGQTETVTTTTTSTGTIVEYSPGSTFVVKESGGPVTYTYGTGVSYITRSGKALTDDQVRTHIKVGTPVNVHYTTQGDNRIIERVEIDEIEVDD